MYWTKYLTTFLLSALIPQLIKLLFDVKQNKKVNFVQNLVETGGMPSSHACLTAAMTTLIFLEQGPNLLFFFALAIAAITIRDATGVRYAVGEQAKAINELIEKKLIKTKKPKKVRIILGHTPTQALAGVLLGAVISLIIYII